MKDPLDQTDTQAKAPAIASVNSQPKKPPMQKPPRKLSDIKKRAAADHAKHPSTLFQRKGYGVQKHGQQGTMMTEQTEGFKGAERTPKPGVETAAQQHIARKTAEKDFDAAVRSGTATPPAPVPKPAAAPTVAPAGPAAQPARQPQEAYGNYGGTEVFQKTGENGEPVFFGMPNVGPGSQPVTGLPSPVHAMGGAQQQAPAPGGGAVQQPVGAAGYVAASNPEAQQPDGGPMRLGHQGATDFGSTKGGNINMGGTTPEMQLLQKWYSLPSDQRGRMPASVAAASGLPAPTSRGELPSIGQSAMSDTERRNERMRQKSEMDDIMRIRNPKTRREAMRNYTAMRGQDMRAATADANRAAGLTDGNADRQEARRMELAKMLQSQAGAKSKALYDRAKLALEQGKMDIDGQKAVADLMKAQQGNLKTETWTDPVTGEPGGVLAFDTKNPQAEPQFYSFADISSAMKGGTDDGGPSADQLKEGAVTMNEDGTEGWTLIDGVPTQVR